MVNFPEEAKQIAYDQMIMIDESLCNKYSLLIEFLTEYPDAAAKSRSKKIKTGSSEYIVKNAQGFAAAREIRYPKSAQTEQDLMVPFIMQEYFDVPAEKIDEAVEWHRHAMGAENIIGELLERYIATDLEDMGWIWCSGSLVKAVDFVHRSGDGEWTMLQVKNRDNSENSSSSAIRKGTNILKWFRTFSTKPGDNWHNFPALGCNHSLSEDGFKTFVKEYLENL